MSKILTIAIIGMGARGGYAYGTYLSKHEEKFKIVAICDIDKTRLNKWGDMMKVDPANRFISDKEFFKKKRADVLLVTTMDKLHVVMANKGLELGYHLLVEKPISDKIDELRSLLTTARKYKRKVMVCHVLRYTVWIRKCKEIIDSGAIGKLISIDHTENVVYWHQAHSYVRGNWHRREDSTPMIMAKCCHDLDLLQYFAHSRCKSLSSMGDLRYFKKENKPKGSADRCLKCKFVDSCVYSAKNIYIKHWHYNHEVQDFPFTLITDTYPVTEKALLESIKTSKYGKCVYACDNNVVDNQTTIMTFENGITATLKMEAFVKDGGRDIRFFGSEGELHLKEGEGIIVLKKFNGENVIWKITDLTNDLSGHGGGDHRMLDQLYEVMANNNHNIDTSLENSLESHYMALAAEDSRLHGGKLIQLKEYRK